MVDMLATMAGLPKQKCHFYHNAGYCSAGDACRFAYEDTVRAASHSLASEFGADSGRCAIHEMQTFPNDFCI